MNNEAFQLSEGISQPAISWWNPNNYFQIDGMGYLLALSPCGPNTGHDCFMPRRIGRRTGKSFTLLGIPT